MDGAVVSDLSIQRDMHRQIAEKSFEATLRAYILDSAVGLSRDRKYQFGGAYNLISSVKATFEKLAEETGCAYYQTVADKLAEVELMADLPYWHPEAA